MRMSVAKATRIVVCTPTASTVLRLYAIHATSFTGGMSSSTGWSDVCGVAEPVGRVTISPTATSMPNETIRCGSTPMHHGHGGSSWSSPRRPSVELVLNRALTPAMPSVMIGAGTVVSGGNTTAGADVVLVDVHVIVTASHGTPASDGV